MESLLSLLHMHWDHEPPIDETTPRRCCRHLAGSAFLRSVCRQDAGSTLGFIESLDDSEIVHWGHEQLAVPRRTQSADKSDALQTLRARGQVSGGRVSVWSACGFSAAFPRQAEIRCPVMVHGAPTTLMPT